MNLETWQTNNNQYLAASLKWLRLRLEQLAAAHNPAGPPSQPAASPPDQAEIPAPPLLRRFFGSRPGDTQAKTVVPTAPRLLEDRGASLEAQIAEAVQERAAAAKMDPPPALEMLGDQLGLSPFEQEVLLLCAAPELDTQASMLCARAQEDPNRHYPTFALALALFAEASWDALSPGRPLRAWRLLEINQPGATPLTMSALRADERIVNYLKGINVLDDRLTPFFLPVTTPQGASQLAHSQATAATSILQQWERTPAHESLPVAQLLGVDAGSKLAVAQAVAAALNRQLYRLRPSLLPAQLAEQETVTRLWQRECLLLPLALYVDAQDDDAAGSAGQQSSLDQLLQRDMGVALLAVREGPLRFTQPTFAVDVNKPTADEQYAAWGAALEPLTNGENPPAAPAVAASAARALASQFSLNLGEIHAVVADYMAADGAAHDAETLTDDLWARCRAGTRPQLDILAQRLDPKAVWTDLVLPSEQLRLLHQIADQVHQRSIVYSEWGFGAKMNRGLGISALFAGDSGTGKTMAAEVIANALNLYLYRIDLSAVVSKYIGETEKNLRRLFDAAEAGGAILFFDEADALFGKRSEVKDSHDRYANIEINYLLQRMESYSGLAILATNMKNALDPAFMRRLRFIVNFPFPGVAERKQMWSQIFPTQTPTDKLDIDRLARLNLTGGNIHSIALNAAFLAAENASPVNTPLVLAAARTEFRKLDKPINEADFQL